MQDRNFHPFLFAAYPVLALLAYNIEEIKPQDALRSFGSSSITTSAENMNSWKTLPTFPSIIGRMNSPKSQTTARVVHNLAVPHPLGVGCSFARWTSCMEENDGHA
jgi:hypothetical protein